MTLPIRKRRRPGLLPSMADANPGAARFPEVAIFLVEKHMGSSRRAFLGKLARSKGFRVEETYSNVVTHVVSEQNTADEVCEWLEAQPKYVVGSSPLLLDVSWFTESMKAGEPVNIVPRHRLVLVLRHDVQEEEEPRVPAYACQRRTPLPNLNQRFTDALETLAKEAEFNSSEGRSLAFMRAASVLRSLPTALTRLEDLRHLPCFGAHSKKVVQEILEDGNSSEVQQVLDSERYRTLKLFTGVFGVGAKTAYQWYREGIRSLDDLQKQGKKLNREQQAGLLHYKDLNTPVSLSEANDIQLIVRDVVLKLLPGAIVTMTGGFRRGKPSGHDVDFLITHPEKDKEAGLLIKVINLLSSQGLLLYHHKKQNSYTEYAERATNTGRGSVAESRMDHFECCFSIFKLKSLQESIGSSASETGKQQGWKAVRVDLVVCPFDQYPYALLGWTGSKQFERELRRFAVQERKMTLSSHALYDTTQKSILPAHCEEDIFAYLGLEYLPPEERNA